MAQCIVNLDDDLKSKMNVRISINSFDQNLPPIKTKGNSLDDIQAYVLKDSLSIYPRNESDLANWKYSLLTERLKGIGGEGLIYVSRNLFVSANISYPEPVPQPDEAILDVCLLLKGRPPTVFTLVSDEHFTRKDIKRYNLTLVRGVIHAVRRMTTEQFSAVYGLVTLSDIAAEDSFIRQLERIERETSKMCTQGSLVMNQERCTHFIRAYISYIALSTSVVDDDTDDKLWFLTVEQFRVLTENIDKPEVIVHIAPSSGGRVLIREVARRLEKSGKTCLILDSQDDVLIARRLSVCSSVLSLEEWSRMAIKEEFIASQRNIVSNSSDVSVGDKHGRYWRFQEVGMKKHSSQGGSEEEKVLPALSLEHQEKDDQRSERMSVASGYTDSGYYSQASSRRGSVYSEGSVEAGMGLGATRGLLYNFKRRLSQKVQGKNKKCTYLSQNGPVFCFTDGSKRNPVHLLCPQQEMDKDRVNVTKSHVDQSGLLVNTRPFGSPSPGEMPMQEYYGTCSTFRVDLHSKQGAPPLCYYWETECRVAVKKKLNWMTLFEVGVMEERHIDRGGRAWYRPRSWCARIGCCDDMHNSALCLQLRNAGELVNCYRDPLSNIPGSSLVSKLGTVLDVVKGRVAFIDVNKTLVLEKMDAVFRETLYPVFSLYPDSDEATVEMKLISGSEVKMTNEKEELIYACLA